MGKNGISIGSASLVLIFAVLCLAIFSLISLQAALSEKALVEAEMDMVMAYYEADSFALHVLELLISDTGKIPEQISDVAISVHEADTIAQKVSFSIEVTEKKELYVEIVLHETHYDILKWKLQDIYNWLPDSDIIVWLP